mmetsp:Transcript_4091/g.16755  ORF Transcript_4091/g.16755 Transcript_4091/m.16755 type:complete len:293 (-) Transcript_4091:410-1288(-)
MGNITPVPFGCPSTSPSLTLLMPARSAPWRPSCGCRDSCADKPHRSSASLRVDMNVSLRCSSCSLASSADAITPRSCASASSRRRLSSSSPSPPFAKILIVSRALPSVSSAPPPAPGVPNHPPSWLLFPSPLAKSRARLLGDPGGVSSPSLEYSALPNDEASSCAVKDLLALCGLIGRSSRVRALSSMGDRHLNGGSHFPASAACSHWPLSSSMGLGSSESPAAAFSSQHVLVASRSERPQRSTIICLSASLGLMIWSMIIWLRYLLTPESGSASMRLHSCSIMDSSVVLHR